MTPINYTCHPGKCHLEQTAMICWKISRREMPENFSRQKSIAGSTDRLFNLIGPPTVFLNNTVEFTKKVSFLIRVFLQSILYEYFRVTKMKGSC